MELKAARLCKCYSTCIFSTKEDACSCLNSAACSCDVGNFAMVRRINTVEVQLNDPASDPCHIVPVEKEELCMPYEYTDMKIYACQIRVNAQGLCDSYHQFTHEGD